MMDDFEDFFGDLAQPDYFQTPERKDFPNPSEHVDIAFSELDPFLEDDYQTSSPISTSPLSTSPYTSGDSPMSYEQSFASLSAESPTDSYHPKSKRTSSKGSEAPAENSRKRKRRKYTRQEDVKPTPVTLPRQKLLTMSLEQMDDYIKEMKATRKLTEEEDQDLKRQRRLVKNRVSALASRNRKKEDMEQMEDQVARLTKENIMQREQIARLESENNSLKQEVVHLNRLLCGGEFPDFMSEMMKSISPVEFGQSNSKVGGIAVMILLLSFGSLLAPLSFGSGDFRSVPFISPATPSFDEPVQKTPLHPTTELRRKHRDLLQFDETENENERPPALYEATQPNIKVSVSSPSPQRSVSSEGEEPQMNSTNDEDSVLVQVLVPRSALPQIPSAQMSETTLDRTPTQQTPHPTEVSKSVPSISVEETTNSSTPTSGVSCSGLLPSNLVEVACRVFHFGSSAQIPKASSPANSARVRLSKRISH